MAFTYNSQNYLNKLPFATDSAAKFATIGETISQFGKDTATRISDVRENERKSAQEQEKKDEINKNIVDAFVKIRKFSEPKPVHVEMEVGSTPEAKAAADSEYQMKMAQWEAKNAEVTDLPLPDPNSYDTAEEYKSAVRPFATRMFKSALIDNPDKSGLDVMKAMGQSDIFDDKEVERLAVQRDYDTIKSQNPGDNSAQLLAKLSSRGWSPDTLKANLSAQIGERHGSAIATMATTDFAQTGQADIPASLIESSNGKAVVSAPQGEKVSDVEVTAGKTMKAVMQAQQDQAYRSTHPAATMGAGEPAEAAPTISSFKLSAPLTTGGRKATNTAMAPAIGRSVELETTAWGDELKDPAAKAHETYQTNVRQGMAEVATIQGKAMDNASNEKVAAAKGEESKVAYAPLISSGLSQIASTKNQLKTIEDAVQKFTATGVAQPISILFEDGSEYKTVVNSEESAKSARDSFDSHRKQLIENTAANIIMSIPGKDQAAVETAMAQLVSLGQNNEHNFAKTPIANALKDIPYGTGTLLDLYKERTGQSEKEFDPLIANEAGRLVAPQTITQQKTPAPTPALPPPPKKVLTVAQKNELKQTFLKAFEKRNAPKVPRFMADSRANMIAAGLSTGDADYVLSLYEYKAPEAKK